MVRHYRYASFYKINKKNNVSTIELCVEEAKKVSNKDKNYNPVQNSYSALWTEYSTLTSTIPLMNVMCRILEYYFLQLCGYEGHDLTKKVLEDKKDRFITPIEGAAPDMTRFHLAKSMLAYMSDDELAFYDALSINESATEVLGDDKLRLIAREVADKVRRNATIDWTVKESARAKLMVIVRRILKKYGYPPDMQETAIQTVLTQATNLAGEWAK